MEKICPRCNAMQPVMAQCPRCGNMMEDGGPIQDYSDPYGPYIEQNIESYCVHLLFCPVCQYDFRVAWELVCI